MIVNNIYRNDSTYAGGSGRSNYFFFWTNREPNQDKKQVINIRQGLGYQHSQISYEPSDNVLILPGTPITYLNYGYMILPFVTSSHDRGFEVLRKQQQDGRFDFYAFPSERAAYKIMHDYIVT